MRALDIAYGTEKTAEGQAPHPARPRILRPLAEGQVLRIGDLDHQLLPAPGPAELASAEAQVALLHQHLRRLCGTFNGFATRVIDGYFAALRARVDAEAAEIAASHGALKGLLQPLHRLALAPMPLPRAHIALPTGGWLRVPVAFVVGRGLVLCFSAEEALLPSLRANLDALAEEGARVLRLSRKELDPEGLLERLGPKFVDFPTAPGVSGGLIHAGRLSPPQ